MSSDDDQARHVRRSSIQADRQELDLSRTTYSLRELKALKGRLFFVPKKFVEEGFRAHPNMTTYKCFKSLFYLHNESTNIWSHLLPALYFLV